MAKESKKETGLLGYDVKEREKCKFKGTPEISKTSRGGYIAKGKSIHGNNMVCLLSEENAKRFVKEGVAKKAW
jgi:hypothetical protein